MEVNIADRGATPGTAAPQGAIQAAIDEVADNGGGIVRIPSVFGSFWRVDQLRLRTGVWLRGEGRYSELRSIPSNPNSALVVLDAPAVEDFRLSDLAIHGLKTSQDHPIDGVLIDRTGDTNDSRWKLDDLEVLSCSGNGLSVVTTLGQAGHAGTGRVSGGHYMNNDGHGIYLNGNASDGTFIGVQAGLSGRTGFYLGQGAGNNCFVGCTSFWSAEDGWRIGLSRNVIMNGCGAEDNTRHALNLESTENLSGSFEAHRNAGSAVRLSGAKDNRLDAHVGATPGSVTGFSHNRILELAGNKNQNNVLDITYAAAALASGQPPVSGQVGNNEIKVR